MAEDSKSVYYVALSGLQKSVRRCMARPALNMARIAWNVEPYRMWQRLWVILFEDCGRDLDALKFFGDWRGSYKRWEDVSPLVETLVNARKSHDSVGASWMVVGAVDLPDRLALPPDHADRLVMIRDSWESLGFDAYRQAGHPLPWLVDACEHAAKSMRERLSQGCPLLHWDTAQATEKENHAPEDTLLGEVLLPSCALDMHTRPGQFINGVLWKQIGEQAAGFGIAKGDVGMALFMNEGSLLNNRVPLGPDYWQIVSRLKGWARFLEPECREWCREVVIPKARELREWALRKVFPDLLDSMAEALNQANRVQSVALPRLFD